MASAIKSDYKTRAVAFVKGEVINAIARVCSHWASGNCITVHKPENPSGTDPIKWDLDVPNAATAIADEFDRNELWGDGSVTDNSTRKDMVGTNLSGGKISGKDQDGIEYDNPHTDKTTWTRGTDKETVDDEAVDAGLKIMLPCRFISDGIDGYVRFRQFEFDQAGRLVKVGEETESTPYTATT